MTAKTLPKKENNLYFCSRCGSQIYPCEPYCEECYTEIDWDNYNEKLFEMPEMWESYKEMHSNQ